MNARTAWIGVALLACTLAAQCPKQQAPEDDPTAGDRPGTGGQPAAVEQDTVRIARLEREARAIAKTDGCSSADQCRAAPVGDRPCGGPRDYIVYCARTTDSVALYAKLDELRRVERAYNQKSGMMSTCEFRMPPSVALSGGSCVASERSTLRPR